MTRIRNYLSQRSQRYAKRRNEDEGDKPQIAPAYEGLRRGMQMSAEVGAEGASVQWSVFSGQWVIP